MVPSFISVTEFPPLAPTENGVILVFPNSYNDCVPKLETRTDSSASPIPLIAACTTKSLSDVHCQPLSMG